MSDTLSLRATASPNGRPSANGRGYLPEWMSARSRLLDLLPGIYSEGHEAEFLGRYLMVFETIFDSVDATISQLPEWFAPATAPEEFLPWLASWIGLVLDDGWPLDRRRAVLARAMELHRWRGTIRGLTEHLELYTGTKPEIVEGGSGFKLNKKSQLGQQLMLGGDRANHFSVILRPADPETIDRTRIRAVIESHRPAHATYALFIATETDTLVPESDPATNDGSTESA